MEKARRWSDAWVATLEHPRDGKPEQVHHDPQVARHRLVVTRTRKKFEVQMQRPSEHKDRLQRKHYVVQTGIFPDITVEQSREQANVIIGRIRRGEEPRARSPERDVTVGGAWTKYKARSDLGPRTLAMYEGHYRRNLEKWKDESLRELALNPAKAHDEHKAITERAGPSEADHAMRLLRSIYKHAAKLDTSLPGDRNPCSAVEWHGDKKRDGAAIPAKQMPTWKQQVEKLRKDSPLRAAFQMLLLRVGCRPNELAGAEWSQVDLKRKTFWIPDSKEEPYEVPLSAQAIAEFKKLREHRALNKPGKDYVFPSRMGKRGKGHLAQFTEPKDVLLRSSNALRHTHHTIGTRLGVKEIVLDVLEGRSILKTGAAGRGYVDTHELGPELRAAQEKINQEVDRMFAGKAR
jgi:integrase